MASVTSLIIVVTSLVDCIIHSVTVALLHKCQISYLTYCDWVHTSTFLSKAVKGAPQTQGARQGGAFPDSK